ncbi:peptide synthetase [Streptomyces armeniacus]|uniref:Peptide synthetase n=1 Tax=Streptomyces armeniacus TaxID=83291 RepID=A0A345XZG5_9ACTN|nr:non-ribosomal peptide synthetase [Streptomyces armeniacus]AXK37031.1 peptide synthetase [Streptomyces armeniacus]
MPASRTPQDVLARIRRHAAQDPTGVALVVGETTLTYREFVLASAGLAGRLSAAGVRSGQTVVLYQRQSAQTVVGMVAALWLGAAWCVAEPGQPPERLRALVRDVDCGAVVHGGTDAAGEPYTPPELNALREDAPRPLALLANRCSTEPAAGPGARTDVADAYEAVPAPAETSGAAPAYVITTAGSTGEPKAVVVTRDNLARVIEARPEKPGCVTFSPCRLSWDGSLLLLFHALCTGGTAVLPDHRQLPDAAESAALVLHWRVVYAGGPPSYYRLMLPHLAGADAHLREVILAGEVFPLGLLDQHRAVLPRTQLRNEYGPTEATITVLAHPVAGTYREAVPIGRSLGGQSAYVLDERLRPLEPGRLGELYLGGGQIALGYAARPGDTARHFVADPFTRRRGARMYRTGDLVVLDERGEIVFRGRADGQLKVRGVRVERHGVEAALEDHPAVGQATVLGVPDRHGDTRLVAFWSPAEPGGILPTARELVEFCTGRLVGQAVPGNFHLVDSMPLGPSGKTDEDALRALLGTDTAAAGDVCGTDPATAEPPPEARPDGWHGWPEPQGAVARLWSRVLGHDDFAADDSFFTVGGDSRRVVELHLCLQREWPGAVRVGQLFDLDTVESQAELVAAVKPAAPPARGAATGTPEPGDDAGTPGEQQ